MGIVSTISSTSLKLILAELFSPGTSRVSLPGEISADHKMTMMIGLVIHRR